MTAQELINESDGITKQDIEELQLQAHSNLTKCIKEAKNGKR